MPDIQNPHDKFFKEAFARPEVARDFISRRLPNDFMLLFTGPDAFKPYGPNFSFELTDLSQYNEMDVKEELLLRVVLFTMRLMPRQTALEFLDTVLRHMAYTSDNVSREALRRALQKALPDKGEAVMGTLVREWLEEGLEVGRQEGVQEGLLQGQEKAVLSVLRTRFGEVDADFAAALQQINNLDRLHELLRQAVLVPSPEEFRLN